MVMTYDEPARDSRALIRLAISAAAIVAAVALPSVAHADPPPNDDFPGATITNLPFTESLNTTAATFQPDEPYCQTGKNTVWYSYTPPSDSSVLMSTAGSDFPASITVFKGDSLGSLTCLGAISDLIVNDSPLFPVSAGQTYRFQAGGGGASGVPPPPGSGNLVVSFSEVTGPPNDIFPGIEITGLPFSHTVDTTNATVTGEPAMFGATVWYNYTPTENITLVADTFASDYDTVILVKALTDLDTPGLGIIANDNAGGCPQSRVVFPASAGDTLWFQVGGQGFPGATGMLVFNLASAPPSGTPEPSPLCPEAPPDTAAGGFGGDGPLAGFPAGGSSPPSSDGRPWSALLAGGVLLGLAVLAIAARRRYTISK